MGSIYCTHSAAFIKISFNWKLMERKGGEKATAAPFSATL
jgi:hypothetical protein